MQIAPNHRTKANVAAPKTHPTTGGDYIIQTVRYVTGINDFTTNRTRKRPYVTARHLCAYFLHKHTTMTFEKMGQALCPDRPFDHATVMHSVSVANDLIDTLDNVGDFYKNYLILHYLFCANENLK